VTPYCKLVRFCSSLCLAYCGLCCRLTLSFRILINTQKLKRDLTKNAIELKVWDYYTRCEPVVLNVTLFTCRHQSRCPRNVDVLGAEMWYYCCHLPRWRHYITEDCIHYDKYIIFDRLCVIMVTVPCYITRYPGFDSRRYQIFWEVVGVERGPLSLVCITEELLEFKNSGTGSRKPTLTAVWDPLRWPRDNFHPQKLALTSPTCGGRSVGIVRLRIATMEFSIFS
jgi:hypothetical protein